MVEMGNGDGNSADASPPADPEWRQRKRLRLAPSDVDAAGSDENGAGPRAAKRIRPAWPSSSSNSSAASEDEGEVDDDEEADEEVKLEEMQPLAPAAGFQVPAAPRVWPLAFGGVYLTGRLRDMQDTISLRPSFCNWADGSPMHFFAVFDGHGGDLVSVLCREWMHKFLAEELAVEVEALRRRPGEAAAGTSAGGAWDLRAEEERAWRAALSRAFRRVDDLAAFACGCGRVVRPRCSCPVSDGPAGMVGSTAVVALLVRDVVIVANVGDSRAVLCRGPGPSPPVPLSSDHKPNRPDELARIVAAGGNVRYSNGHRVRGILAMSRALGDRLLKAEVIGEPEITITERTVQDECLILATDGMWDMISNEVACNVARQCVQDGNAEDAETLAAGEADDRCSCAASLLAKMALVRGGQDNVSVVVVDLKRGHDH